jgi:cell division protein FtsN
MKHQTQTDDEPILDLTNRTVVFIFLGLLVISGCFFVAGYVFRMRGEATRPPVNYADAGSAINSKVENNPGVEAFNRMSGIVNERVKPPSVVHDTPTPELPKPAVFAAASPETTAAVSAAAPPVVSEPPVSTPDPRDKPKPQPKETLNKPVQSAAKVTLPPAVAADSAKTVYSVQVAAFRARREAELKAKEVEAKGFEPRIEMPLTSDDYYRLKIGNFATRAEAEEMENRLKKSGFDTMIRESKRN